MRLRIKRAAAIYFLVLLMISMIPVSAFAIDQPANVNASDSMRVLLPTPILSSPVNNTIFYHYPRITTLTWRPVTSATKYKVERWYLSGSTWVAYPVVYTYGINNTSYSFTFVGDNTGRWRVTAYSASNYSAPSTLYYFKYNTYYKLPTPTLISPANNTIFYNYPRTVTLAWKPVYGATGYKVERQYYSGGTWSSYAPVTVTGFANSSYKFNFIGKQPGRWRVTALGTAPYVSSNPSSYWVFNYGI